MCIREGDNKEAGSDVVLAEDYFSRWVSPVLLMKLAVSL